MKPASNFRRSLALAAALAAGAVGASAQTGELNLYSARHYQTDEALYENFTKATGIKINRVDADDAGILARLRSEGAASPAEIAVAVLAEHMGHGGSAAAPLAKELIETYIKLSAGKSSTTTSWNAPPALAQVGAP